MANLKSVTNKLIDIFNNITIINKVEVDHISEISRYNENLYPVVWIDNVTNPHTIQESNLLLNYDIYFLDLIKKDRSNFLDIESNMMAIAVDLTRSLIDGYRKLDGWDVKANDYSAEIINYNVGKNELGGCKLSLVINIKTASCENIIVL